MSDCDSESGKSTSDTERELRREIRDLEERVDELEEIINRELGYSLGELSMEPQEIDCVCGEMFKADITNGLICPECGRGSDDRGDCDA